MEGHNTVLGARESINRFTILAGLVGLARSQDGLAPTGLVGVGAGAGFG